MFLCALTIFTLVLHDQWCVYCVYPQSDSWLSKILWRRPIDPINSLPMPHPRLSQHRGGLAWWLLPLLLPAPPPHR